MNKTIIDMRDQSMFVHTPLGIVYIDWSCEDIWVDYWVEDEDAK